MHRIPLLIETPSIFWERNQPEWLLFERTLNKANVYETDTFLTILDSEAELYENQCYKKAKDMLSAAEQHLTDQNSFVEGMLLINYIIIRSPKDSPELASALKIRGNYNFHEYSFKQASRDYEMFLEVHKILKSANEDICEVCGHLAICMYMMRQLEKVKIYFRSYKKYKDKLLPEIVEKSTFVKIEKYIGQFMKEVDNLESVPKFPEIQYKGTPYKGFTSSGDIPSASAVCSYYNNGIYVENEVPKSSVLFVEDPVLNSLNTPFLQCEVCYVHLYQIFTCLNCRYKTYCSLNCLQIDIEEHKYECVGYKQLTLLILDASNIFRMFVRISKQLDEHVLNPQIFRKTRTAGDVWNKIMVELNKGQVPNTAEFSMIKIKPKYFCLADMQYSTLVATAFRLSLFIEKKTDIIDRYYNKLNISNKQKLILIGTILMRIHCNILLNTFDFEISRTPNEDQVENNNLYYMSIKQIGELLKTMSRRQGFIESIHKFYNIEVNRDIWQRSAEIINSNENKIDVPTSSLTILRHVQPCNHLPRVISTYKDSIIELYFKSHVTYNILFENIANQPINNASSKVLNHLIAKLSDTDRCLLVEKFARLFHSQYIEYFLQLFERDGKMQQILSVYCPTLRKLKHSCNPNIEVIVLDNGVVIGKALRKISKGEQLYVSYKAHYMYHVRMDRQMFLQFFSINCKCEYCKMNDIDEPTNLRLGIFCESCKGVIITPCQSVCPLCNIPYTNLFNKYRMTISVLEYELRNVLDPNEADERDIYLLHKILCSYAKLYFVPQNEVRIAIELRLAHFLALKNFAKQSYDLIQEIRKNILESYDERIVWFTFYAEILLIIKIILWNNFDENKFKSLSTSSLYELCSFGLHIVFGQKDYIEFYENFDKECSNILDDIKLLLKWKEGLLCSEYFSMAKSLNSTAE